MTRQLFLTPDAVQDVDDIWTFGAATWSKDRADRYIDGLKRLIALLAETPELARLRDEVFPPVRIHRYRSHVIVFRETGETLQVLRILHGHSDWLSVFSA